MRNDTYKIGMSTKEFLTNAGYAPTGGRVSFLEARAMTMITALAY